MRSNAFKFTLLFIGFILLIIIDLITGSVSIPVSEIISGLTADIINPTYLTIIREIRLPRIFTAILAGMALSVAGLQMQTIFRNPLAGPYVLGITSGSGLGVALLLMAPWTFFSVQQAGFIGNWAIIIASWVGAGLVLFIILIVSFRIRDVISILVLGIMFGSALSAIISVLQYFSNESMLKAYIIWTMGSLGAVSPSQLTILFPSIFIGILFSFLSGKMLNTLLAGENYTKSLGFNIKKIRIWVFVSTSILAGSVTAFCGPIGFIGIAVPHMCRMLFKTTNHFTLLTACCLVGPCIMLFSDIFSQLPGSQNVIPINSVTAIVGIPVIVWIIVRNRKLHV